MVAIKRKFKEDCCPICMKDIKYFTVLNPCFHEFCLNCIGSWLVMKFSCPMCKQIPEILYYNMNNDKYHSSIQLNSKFKDIWTQRSRICNLLDIVPTKISQLKKALRLLLLDFKYPVELLRKMFYFCDLKTVLCDSFKVEWNQKTLAISPSHNIWDWVKIELSVFFPRHQVWKFMETLKSKVHCYKQLEIELSTIIPAVMFHTFISELNTFLSFPDSCENYYYLQECKTIIHRPAGHTTDVVVIEKGTINLRLFSRIIATKLFELEFGDVDVHRDDLMPIYEMSNLSYVVNFILSRESLKESKEGTISLLMSFFALRMSRMTLRHNNNNDDYCNRSMRSDNSCPPYIDHFRLSLNIDYRFIYLTCLRDMNDRLADQLKHCHKDTTSVAGGELIDLTTPAKVPRLTISIDLTED